MSKALADKKLNSFPLWMVASFFLQALHSDTFKRVTIK